MPTTIEFDITQDDIDHGLEKSCSMCPAALALKRKFSDSRIKVYCDSTNIDGILYYNGYCLQLWIRQYDTRKEVRPGSFKIERISRVA